MIINMLEDEVVYEDGTGLPVFKISDFIIPNYKLAEWEYSYTAGTSSICCTYIYT